MILSRAYDFFINDTVFADKIKISAYLKILLSLKTALIAIFLLVLKRDDNENLNLYGFLFINLLILEIATFNFAANQIASTLDAFYQNRLNDLIEGTEDHIEDHEHFQELIVEARELYLFIILRLPFYITIISLVLYLIYLNYMMFIFSCFLFGLFLISTKLVEEKCSIEEKNKYNPKKNKAILEKWIRRSNLYNLNFQNDTFKSKRKIIIKFIIINNLISYLFLFFGSIIIIKMGTLNLKSYFDDLLVFVSIWCLYQGLLSFNINRYYDYNQNYNIQNLILFKPDYISEKTWSELSLNVTGKKLQIKKGDIVEVITDYSKFINYFYCDEKNQDTFNIEFIQDLKCIKDEESNLLKNEIEWLKNDTNTFKFQIEENSKIPFEKILKIFDYNNMYVDINSVINLSDYNNLQRKIIKICLALHENTSILILENLFEDLLDDEKYFLLGNLISYLQQKKITAILINKNKIEKFTFSDSLNLK
jgi:hypothetical protein